VSTVEFRNLLEEERARLAGAVKFLHDESAASLEGDLGEIAGGADDSLGDAAGMAYDREIDLGLEEGTQQTIEEIDAALERIEAGTYGTCESCGKAIGEARLRAIPWARYCIDDQRRAG
jgi:DnaK suppressor protein